MGVATVDGIFVGPCYYCKSQIWIPVELYNSCKRSSKIGFFCAYGHEQVFAREETEEAKLRRERDRLVQQMAFKDDQIRSALKKAGEAEAARVKLAKEAKAMKTRVSAGTCPCCHRTVSQMARHMKTKHPNFIQAHEVH